ncbi:hypothetical protein ACQ9LF_04310 [Anaerohalosphaeraceae bacterium U12dextr]
MKAIWMVLVMCVSIVFVTGCSLSNQTAFGHDGLPKEQYRVGGGLLIEYKAPQDGTFYLVDQKSGKFIVTQSVDEGSTFDFSLPHADEDQYKGLAQSLVSGELVLYFVPNPPQVEEQQQ